MATMPKQKPGKSEQVVCTPPEFLQAVKNMLRIKEFDIDLAASKENTVATKFYSEEDNSLVQDWSNSPGGWNWLNPPYEKISPWLVKAISEMGENHCNTAVLVPSSVGSNWWLQYVHNRAYVIFLNGRITFVGHKSPYPKDLALLLYAPFLCGGYTVWSWK